MQSLEGVPVPFCPSLWLLGRWSSNQCAAVGHWLLGGWWLGHTASLAARTLGCTVLMVVMLHAAACIITTNGAVRPSQWCPSNQLSNAALCIQGNVTELQRALPGVVTSFCLIGGMPLTLRFTTLKLAHQPSLSQPHLYV